MNLNQNFLNLRRMAVRAAIIAALSVGIAYAATDFTLTWTAPPVTPTQSAATGYKIYKSTNATTCAATAPLPGPGIVAGSATTATDNGVAEGTTICWETSATNAGGEGPRSNRVTKVVPVNPPGAPVLTVVP